MSDLKGSEQPHDAKVFLPDGEYFVTGYKTVNVPYNFFGIATVQGTDYVEVFDTEKAGMPRIVISGDTFTFDGKTGNVSDLVTITGPFRGVSKTDGITMVFRLNSTTTPAFWV